MFGVPNEKPRLPHGWRYIEAPHLWLLAESPYGRRYYVSNEGDGVLYKQVVTPTGTLALDEHQVVVLPQKQLT